MTTSTAYRVGDNILITVSNRPWVDMTVPLESNDYRSAEEANIKIYGPCEELLMDAEMCEVPGRPGWYYFNYQTTALCNKPGLHRVVVQLGCYYPICGGRTVCTTGSSGTSGCPETPSTTGVGTSGTSGVGTSGSSGTPCTTGSSGSPEPEIDLVYNSKESHFRLIEGGVI